MLALKALYLKHQGLSKSIVTDQKYTFNKFRIVGDFVCQSIYIFRKNLPCKWMQHGQSMICESYRRPKEFVLIYKSLTWNLLKTFVIKVMVLQKNFSPNRKNIHTKCVTEVSDKPQAGYKQVGHRKNTGSKYHIQYLL